MPDDTAKPKLTIVRRPQRLRIPEYGFAESKTQGTLFPLPRRGLLIFVHFPDVTEEEFCETIEHANPAYIFELRSSPRFDIGRLNRHLAFEAFRRSNTTYLDLTSSSMGKIDSDGVISSLRGFLQAHKPLLDRPIVFLIHRGESGDSFIDRVLETVAAFGTQPSQVFEIPSFLTDVVAP